ncbi:MAG: hypothetical protein H6732_16490 [Alphaproteobacteria bacterium]|nr:hypothetical protein [Alphaproteobacteria bacterium]
MRRRALSLWLITACAPAAPDAPRDSDDAHDTDAVGHTDLPVACVDPEAPCDVLPAPADDPACGAVLRADPDAPFPERLSALACLAAGDPWMPAEGVVPYDLATPLFSEGVRKARFWSTSAAAPVDPVPDAPWVFPEGAVVLKVFGHPGAAVHDRPLEVRVMARLGGAWRFQGYAWDEALADGVRVDDDLLVTLPDEDDAPWWFPSARSCPVCHRAEALEVLGPRTAQLARTVVHEGVRADQLVALWQAGWLASLPSAAERAAGWADPHGDAPLEQRVRSWLQGNCAHCHRPGGFRPPDLQLDLRLDVPLDEMAACDVQARGRIARGRGPLIAPGDAAGSVIVQRIQAADAYRMPPDGGREVDQAFLDDLVRWIDGLEDCTPTAAP